MVVPLKPKGQWADFSFRTLEASDRWEASFVMVGAQGETLGYPSVHEFVFLTSGANSPDSLPSLGADSLGAVE